MPDQDRPETSPAPPGAAAPPPGPAPAPPGPAPAPPGPAPAPPGTPRPPSPRRSGPPDRSVLEQAIDAATVRRVFGETYEVGATTVIPVARVHGSGGGGGSFGEEGSSSGGSGVGYAVRAEPAGVYVVSGTTVTWQPALDVGRIALTLGLAFFAAATAVGWAAVARRP